MLQVQDRDRIRFVDEHEASYVITNFRAHPEDHPYPEIIYEIRRLNSPIIRIYKLR